MTSDRIYGLSVASVIANLRQDLSRIKTAILLVEPDQIAEAPDFAACLGIKSIDYSELLLTGNAADSDFVNISATTEERRLSDLLDNLWQSDCLLIYNADLAVSAMDPLSREQFWKNLFQNFPVSNTKILLLMPVRARHLLPQEQNYTEWQSSGRLGYMST